MDWESKQTFFQIKYADSQQAHDTCSKSLIIREMQIKSQWHIIVHVRMAIIKKAKNNTH